MTRRYPRRGFTGREIVLAVAWVAILALMAWNVTREIKQAWSGL